MRDRKTRTEIILTALKIPIQLKQVKRGWIACPFHNVQEPRECFVRLSGVRAMTFHCFACKAGGPLWKLAKKVRDCTADEAREFIREAGKGFELPKAKRIAIVDRANIRRHVFHMPPGFETGLLTEWPTFIREKAEERGIDQLAIDEYGIGYAIVGRLAMRLVMPVLDQRGRPVSYNARTLIDDRKKYLTPSEEHENPDMDAIFGAHLWPSIDDRKVVVMTEGAIDAFSVRRATGLPSGSISGSDVRPRHIQAISTFAIAVIMTDADASGEKASNMLIKSGLGRHVTLVRLALDGGDANVWMMRDPEQLRARVMSVIR